jgi:hypothetical protein
LSAPWSGSTAWPIEKKERVIRNNNYENRPRGRRITGVGSFPSMKYMKELRLEDRRDQL